MGKGQFLMQARDIQYLLSLAVLCIFVILSLTVALTFIIRSGTLQAILVVGQEYLVIADIGTRSSLDDSLPWKVARK